MPGPSSRRDRLPPRSAVAFAPAAITNFFSISYRPSNSHHASPAGATGGGYVLSKGVVSKATVKESGGRKEITTIVNGDPTYNARTTRRALRLLIDHYGLEFGRLELQQFVDVPIGFGFGASAASALSAVYAVGSALDLRTSKSDLARCAHDAEIIEQTGLGTVPVIYDGAGAGAVTVPGIPGVSEFLNVRVPRGIRIVTASIAPYEKHSLFSSEEIARKIVKFGDQALDRLIANPTLKELAEAGEWFSGRLRLGSDEVRKLAQEAKSAGASYASQNMAGHAIHALADEQSASRVVEALKKSGLNSRIDVFEIGSAKAGVF